MGILSCFILLGFCTCFSKLCQRQISDNNLDRMLEANSEERQALLENIRENRDPDERVQNLYITLEDNTPNINELK